MNDRISLKQLKNIKVRSMSCTQGPSFQFQLDDDDLLDPLQILQGINDLEPIEHQVIELPNT